MSDRERWLSHLANLLVGGTGLVYFWMAWLLVPPDDWAVINHPWQPALQHAHVLTAPLFVFAAGILWRSHVAGRLRSRRFTASGLALLALLAPMILSGYALQISGDLAWRDRWAWLHVSSSLLWLTSYLTHGIRARSRAAHPAV